MEPWGQLDLLLLATLNRLGPGHGYGLIAVLRQASGGVFDLGEGSVYPALHRLERGGAVVSSVGGAGPATGSATGSPGGSARRRRVYRLTGAGQTLLAVRRRQWQDWTTAVERVVGPG